MQTNTEYLDAARAAARWIATVPVADPSLYSGRAGIVVFYLELSEATGDPTYRAAAEALGRELLETIDDEQAGLYDGVAGIGFALGELSTRVDARYRAALARIAEVLRSRARRVGRGRQW